MEFNNKSLGLIETRGILPAVKAADAASKAADVEVVSELQRSGGGIITVCFTGDVAAVQAAVEAGGQAAKEYTAHVSTCVIPRPNDEVGKLL